MNWPSGFILYAIDDSEQSITEARAYVKDMGLTKDQVSLIRKDGMIMVRVR